VSKSPPPASATAPPETQEATATPRQVTLLPPYSGVYFFPSLHAERIAFCMQGWGEINSPRPFCSGPGGSWPSPAFWAGFGPEENTSLWAEIGPIHFWAEIGPTFFGLSPTQLFGQAQPDLILYIIYIIFCIIYIYM